MTLPPAASHSPSWWNREVIFLFAATFLAYANNSVFFQFYEYLHTLPIEVRWFGLLISVFSAVSLIVRPVVSSLLHRGNAYRSLLVGTALVIVTLAAYSLGQGLWSLLLVRSLHATAYVLLGAALMTVTVTFIPRERSAQFFGFLAILILIPNTMIPPALPFLTRLAGGFPQVLILFALINLLMFPLVLAARSFKGTERDPTAASPLSRQEILRDLRDTRVVLILAAMLLLYSAHALIFFFLDGYGRSLGIEATGFFLTLSTLGEIGVRLAASSFFDRGNKASVAALTMTGIALAYALLSLVRESVPFFSLGLVLGLGWGIAMPVFNGLIFDVSLPRLRAFNTNLGLQMFQAGFFLGPFVGAPVTLNLGFPALFLMCAAFSLVSAALAFLLKHRGLDS
ncbi:MAG: MFS transporter [Thermodesulfobacteriota bacterium]